MSRHQQHGDQKEKEQHSSGAGLTGWRDILLAEGPDAWAKAVRSHPGTLITDTTWYVQALKAPLQLADSASSWAIFQQNLA